MKPLKRGMSSIIRNKTKSMILFCTILSLSSMIIASLIVRESIRVTEEQIELKLQPAAMVVLDLFADEKRWQEYANRNEVHQQPILELSQIRTIGSLPYVKSYEFFAAGSYFTPNLRTYNPSVNGYLYKPLCMIDSDDSRDLGHLFHFRGVQTSYFLDLRYNSIEITSGRTFLPEEIDSDKRVVLISEELARYNQLGIGSTIQVLDVLFDPSVPLQGFDWHSGNAIDIYAYELEVIGLFRTPLDGSFELLDDGKQASLRGRLGNRIYVPNDFIESSKNRKQELVALLPYVERNSDCFFENSSLVFSQLIIDQFARISYDNFFVLNNPDDIIPFYHATQELLPDLHMIEFMDSSILEISRTLDSISSYSTIILIISCLGITIILNLIVILSIQSRKKEVGIYVALGEKKSRILSQLFLEISVISVFAFYISLILGIILADLLSSQILQSQLMIHAESWNPFPRDRQASSFVLQGLASDMQMLEVLTGLSLRLNLRTILEFLSLGFVIIGTSILFSMVCILQINPHKILSSN